MKNNQGIKLFSPATISMLSYGMKDVTITIDKPGNEILAYVDKEKSGVSIDLFTNSKNDLEGVQDSVVKFANHFLKKIDSKFGIRFKIYNRIPFLSGLGELEANITGVIIAINDLLKVSKSNLFLFEFIIDKSKELDIDILPSNVAANLFGGIILYNKTLNKPIQKLYAPSGLNITIINIQNTINKDIFNNISNSEFFSQSINNATFIKSLFETDHDMLSNSLKNNVFENKIASKIDWYNDVKDISYANAVYAIGFSHYGETVFILNPNTSIKDDNIQELEKYFRNKKIKCELISTIINLNGAYKY
jgi:homoserine kinase